jgi:hypothetical protein
MKTPLNLGKIVVGYSLGILSSNRRHPGFWICIIEFGKAGRCDLTSWSFALMKKPVFRPGVESTERFPHKPDDV